MKNFILFLILIFTFQISFSQIFSESFENSWSPNPTNWYQEEIQSGSGDGSNQWWQQSVYTTSWSPSGYGEPTGAADGSSVAWYNDYEAQAGQIDRLATNDIDLSGTTNPVVSFFLYLENGGVDFRFVASNDGGATWNDISGQIPVTDTYWKKYTFFLPSEYRVNNARIGFQLISSYGMFDVWLDNVSIIDAPAALSGIKTIDNTQPTAGDNFQNFTDAFEALNTSGVADGGVIFNVAEGQIFSENPPQLIISGTENNQIVFQSATPGDNNPTIKPTGTGEEDYGINIHETSFVTFDGINIECQSTNFNYELQLEYGILLSNNSSNNTIKNCNIDLNKSNQNFSIGIVTKNGGNNNNLFQNNNITDCSGGYYLGDVSGVEYDNGNIITASEGSENSISNIGTSTMSVPYFVRFNYQENFVLSNTDMSNLSGNNAPIYGIYCNDGLNTTSQIYSNTITNIEKTGTTVRFVAGVYLSSGNHEVFGNKINNINSLSGDVVGTYISAYGTNYLYQNEIFDVNYTGSDNYFASGANIDIGSSSNTYIYNNLIYDIKAETGFSDTDNPVNASGIYLEQGNIFVYYNSILLNYEANNSNNKSSAIFAQNHYSEYDIRNNIFVNKTSGTFAQAIAFFHNSTDYSDILNTSNNNLYYAGTPSTNNLIFYDGTNSAQTIDNYKILSNNFDLLSITEDVNFVSSTEPFDLHVNQTIATTIESAGLPINSPISITNDFDNNIRNSTTPDIGACEADYLIADFTGPSINYENIKSTINTENYILVEFTEMTDASGIDVSDNKPRLYYKKHTDQNIFTGNTSSNEGWKYVEAENNQTPFDFTIDYSILYNSQGGDGTAEQGDIIEYFVVAQDVANSQNVSAEPSVGFSATSVSNISSAPSSPNFYFIADIYYDFEADNDQRFWHEPDFGYSTDDWERGTPTGGDNFPTELPSGTNCWATNLTGNYSNSALYYLYSPRFETYDNIFILDFSEFLYTEQIQFDSVWIEYQINNFIWFPIGNGYARTDVDWSNKILYFNNLNPGDDIIIRWGFSSDFTTSYAGWYIDDVLVRGGQTMSYVNFTVVDEDANPVSYPHIWIDGDDNQYIGEQDGTKTVPVVNGEHSYIANGPQHDYQFASDIFNIENEDIDITIVLYRESSISEINDYNISIFPNPANEIIYINANKRNTINKIILRDLTGRILLDKNFNNLKKTNIITNAYERGTYFIEIHSEKGIFNTKIIIL